MIHTVSIGAGALYRDSRSRSNLRQNLLCLLTSLILNLGKGNYAHAERQLHYSLDVTVAVETDDTGTLLNSSGTLLRANDDGFCTEGLYQCTSKHHDADHTISLRALMRNKDKSDEDEDRIAGLYNLHQFLCGMHGKRLTGVITAALVKNTADTVAAGIKIHQRIKIFTHIIFDKLFFCHSHCSYPFQDYLL